MFLNDLITSYVAKLKENIAARFPSLPLVQAFSIFDFQVLSVKEAPDFKIYGMNHIATLSDHFGATGYVEVEALNSEWEHYFQVYYTRFEVRMCHDQNTTTTRNFN